MVFSLYRSNCHALSLQTPTFTCRLAFSLPVQEKLDGDTVCAMFTPYNKQYVWGKLYISQNYIAFRSRVPLLCLFNYIAFRSRVPLLCLFNYIAFRSRVPLSCLFQMISIFVNFIVKKTDVI